MRWGTDLSFSDFRNVLASDAFFRNANLLFAVFTNAVLAGSDVSFWVINEESLRGLEQQSCTVSKS